MEESSSSSLRRRVSPGECWGEELICNLSTVVAYVDGSCWPNPGGPGGWAVVFEDGRTFSGRIPAPSTNNRAEIHAALEAIRLGATKVISDSQYVVRIGGRRDFDREINGDLWAQFEDLPQVKFQWIKGHNGNSFNETAHLLAEEARTAKMPGKTIRYLLQTGQQTREVGTTKKAALAELKRLHDDYLARGWTLAYGAQASGFYVFNPPGEDEEPDPIKREGIVIRPW